MSGEEGRIQKNILFIGRSLSFVVGSGCCIGKTLNSFRRSLIWKVAFRSFLRIIIVVC